jgi:hypothetical protein
MRRDPCTVEAFLNGVLCAARRNSATGRWEDVYMAGRSDMAIVRSLRDGRRRQVAVRVLILHEDEGLRRDPATYPDLPRVPVKESIGESIIPAARPRTNHASIANSAAARQRLRARG